jgi:hypothetical protein
MSDAPGWTPDERIYRTPYGRIFYGGPCRDDYRNLVTYDQGGGQAVIVLQRAAMRALWAAQVRFAKRSGWSDARLARNPKGRPIRILPGSHRTCEQQAALYRQDPRRFARPEITGHTRGLAIDVDQSQPRLDVIRRCLIREGWRQVRPDDEPWHYSYFVEI